MWILLTFGDTTLINSFKNLYFPTSLWNLLPQFFIHASNTCTQRHHHAWFSSWETRLLANILVTHFLLSEPEEPPILVASGFCGRAELQLFEDYKKKLQMREKSALRQLNKMVAKYFTYPSSSLLIWSQKPMMYSQSSCLFVGWVALSDGERDDLTYVTSYYVRLVTNRTVHHFFICFC